jgi:hypothetical protein
MIDEEQNRTILKRYVNRRIEVEGTISRVGTFWDSQARCNVPSVCLTNPEIRDDEHPVVSSHVWIAYAQLITNAGVDKGDTIRCTVQVYSYLQRDQTDPNKTTTRYGFREPRDLKCLNRELTPAQEPAKVEAARPAEVEPVVVAPVAAVAPTHQNGITAEAVLARPQDATVRSRPVDPKRVLFDTLYHLIADHGLEKVEKTLAAVKALVEV